MHRITTAIGSMSVNEVICICPESVVVFNGFGIDACCGGSVSVVDAAVRDGLDADRLIAELQRVIESAA